MISESPLLIFARIPEKLDLMHLPWCSEAKARISVNSAKFRDLDVVELVIDGMTFILSRLSAVETQQLFDTEIFERLSCCLPSPGQSAIAIGMQDNIITARQNPEVNHRLLLLGKWIGESLRASAAAWLPSCRLASFEHFREAVQEYGKGGAFPAVFQTSFSEPRKSYFVTSGLSYFIGQEIHLSTPPEYSVSDVTQRLVRIIEDMVAHGKIEYPGRSRGMVDGEELVFLPAIDRSKVDITIEYDAAGALPTVM